MHVLSPRNGMWTHVEPGQEEEWLEPRAQRMLIGKCNIKYFLNVNKYLAAGRSKEKYHQSAAAAATD